MLDDLPGPSWLVTDLPYPIARFWRQALIANKANDTDSVLAMARAAVEEALRFVTALQLCNLLDGQEAEFPRRMRATLKRPSLGSLGELSMELGPDLKSRAFVRDLVEWPSRYGGDGEEARRQRNLLAHWDAPDLSMRAEKRQEFLAMAARLLESLDWLRDLPLLHFSTIRATAAGDGQEAQVRELRGWDGDERSATPMRFEGALRTDRLYAWDSAGQLLDLHPFYRLDDGGVAGWSGLGDRGDVRLSDNRYHPDPPGWKEPRERTIAVRLLDRLRPYDAPAATIARAPRRAVVQAGRGKLVAGVAIGFLAALSVPIAAGLGGSEAPADARGAAASCPDDLVGTWLFQTQVLGAKQRFQRRSVGVRGHYELAVRRGDCPLDGGLKRLGYTQDGNFTRQERSAAIRLVPSATGRTATLSARLAGPHVKGATIDMDARLAVIDGRLFGLWRNVGAMGDEYGYWGTVIGHDEVVGNAAPAGLACLRDCPPPCDQSTDPLDPVTEGCLLACAAKATSCREQP